MKVKQWKVINNEEVFKKFGRGINKTTFELPDGKQEEFYIKVEGPTVCVLAITTSNKIIVLEQFRPGPNKILYELPGGFAQKVDPLEQIQKELKEETGYEGDFKFVTGLWDDAYSTMYRYCFVATNCKRTSKLSLEKNEFLQPRLISMDTLRKILKKGEMTDIESAYLCLDYLNLL